MRKSDDVAVHWQGKESVMRKNNKWTESKLLKISGAIGTNLLQDYTSYWEVDISCHLRNMTKNRFVVCSGICAYHKIDAVNNLSFNYFFYGIAWGTGTTGKLELGFIDGGSNEKDVTMRQVRHYSFTAGFLYDAVNVKLSIINVKQNEVIYTTRKLKGKIGCKCIYVPVFDTNPIITGEVDIKYRTGMDILEIPSCISQLL